MKLIILAIFVIPTLSFASCELLESKEEYGYSQAICNIDGQAYKIELDYLGNDTRIIETKKNITIYGYSGKIKYELTIINKTPPIAEFVTISENAPFDYDNKQTRCSMKINTPLQVNTIFNPTGYFDQLDDNREKKDICINNYDISRSLKEIYEYLDPSNREGLKADILDFGYSTAIGNRRYLGYLAQYPLSTSTEEIYTQMAAWLVGYKLYNEAILLATNIMAFNPDSINADLTLKDAYNAEASKDGENID